MHAVNGWQWCRNGMAVDNERCPWQQMKTGSTPFWRGSVLTLDRDGRAWKGFDWSVMNRLHHKGMIRNPVGKAQSVFLAEEGIAGSERLFREMFAKTI